MRTHRGSFPALCSALHHIPGITPGLGLLWPRLTSARSRQGLLHDAPWVSGCLLSCSLAWADSTPTRPGLFHQWPDWSYSLPLTPWLGRTDLPGFRQRRIKTTFTLLNRVPSGKFNRVNFCYMLRQAHHVLSLSKDTTAAFTLPACRQAGLPNPGLRYVVPIRQAQGHPERSRRVLPYPSRWPCMPFLFVGS